MARWIWISVLCGVLTMVTANNRYSMTRTPRGRCVIISNEKFEPQTGQGTRYGAHIDVIAMQRQFTSLGFKVQVQKDVKLDYLMNIVYHASFNQQNSDAFVMVIMTKGDENFLWAVDKRFHIDQILNGFKGTNAPDLVGKPKLFFVEAPRGPQYDSGVMYDPSRTKRAPGPQIPIESDFLIAYSTSPGYNSFMNARKGSWFIETLNKRLTLHARTLDLIKILTRTSYEVASAYVSHSPNFPDAHNKKQQPQIVSMLTKDVYFF